MCSFLGELSVPVSAERPLNGAFTDGSAPVGDAARMRMKTFAWVVAAILLILVIAFALDRHGGDLTDWAARLHGR